MTNEIQWSNPFDEAGIEQIADWMAPRVGQSPMYRLAIESADPELLAVLLERLLLEYLEYRELAGSVRRDGNLVYVAVGEGDDDTEPVNLSVPLFRALLLRMNGPGGLY